MTDAEIITNEQGGRQSKINVLFTDFDPADVLRVAAVSAMGNARYGPKNYLKIPTSDHLNHAIAHIYEALAGNTSEDHLAHAVCRLHFAMATERQNESEENK